MRIGYNWGDINIYSHTKYNGGFLFRSDGSIQRSGDRPRGHQTQRQRDLCFGDRITDLLKQKGLALISLATTCRTISASLFDGLRGGVIFCSVRVDNSAQSSATRIGAPLPFLSCNSRKSRPYGERRINAPVCRGESLMGGFYTVV